MARSKASSAVRCRACSTAKAKTLRLSIEICCRIWKIPRRIMIGSSTQTGSSECTNDAQRVVSKEALCRVSWKRKRVPG